MSGLPSGGGTVALGVLVGLLSACVQSIGLTLQRKSHLLEEQKEEEDDYERRPPYRRRRWQLGMLMFLISNIVGSTIQITTLPLPVLSTLQASGLVFNTACATLLLKEPFTRYSIIGTVLVAGGAVLIALFGAMSEPSHNLDQLLFLLGERQFIMWVSGTFVIVIGVLVAIWFQERLISRSNHRVRLILGLAYGSISGILSAHCLLLAKSAVELIVRTIVDHINQFNRWQSWMILVGLVVLALSQLYFLHRGLKLCSTSVLYPFVFCIYNIIAILDGLIYFQQASRISSLHAGLIALGTVILLAGVFALSWRLDPEYQAIPADFDGKAVARVATSHSALAPGMGLVDTEQPIDPDHEAQHHQGGDEESNVGRTPRTRFETSENTPLLRAQTSPTPWRRRSKNPTNGSMFRPPRLRRITVPDDTAEIWDELNNDNNNESRRFSGVFSPEDQLSPSHSRRLKRRQRAGTAGSSRTRDRPTSSSHFGTFGAGSIIKWPTWDKGKKPRISFDQPPAMTTDDEEDELHEHAHEHDRQDNDDDDSDNEAMVADGTVRRNIRSWTTMHNTKGNGNGNGSSSSRGRSRSKKGRRRSETNAPLLADNDGWFRLRWWKRRWRSDEDGENNDDGNHPPS